MSDKVREDAEISNLQSDFAKNFEGSAREKNPGRAQLFMAMNSSLSKASEEALDPLMPECFKMDDEAVKLLDSEGQVQWLTKPSVFGFGPDMTYVGLEFQASSCFRIQVDGARHVAVCKYDHMRKIAGCKDHQELMKWVHTFQKQSVWANAAADKDLVFVVANPGDVLYTPPACIVAEATHQGLRGWGVRIPLLPKVRANV